MTVASGVQRRTSVILLGFLAIAGLSCRKERAGEATAATSSSASQVNAPASAATARAAPDDASAPSTADRCPAAPLALPPPPAVDGLSPPTVDIDDKAGALTHFFDRVAALMQGRTKEPVRIAVYGDSNGTMDYMTGAMRRVLQGAHGDAGHGFIALARPWPWYRHQDVVADYQHDAWDAFTVTTHPTPALDPWYGQGLIVAQSKQNGASTWVTTAPEGAPVGTHASRFELWYLAWPPGGKFDMKVDGEVKASADTHAEGEPSFGFVRADVPDGPHKMTAVTRSPRPVRLLGAVLEREEPGFQVDGLGVGSLNCLCVLRESEALDRQIFAHRPYDLVVFHIGSNTWNPAVMDPVRCMTESIARLRRSMPDVSVMIMTPPDWGADGATHTPKWFRRATDQLRRAADEAPAAFFDFWSAMGGEGSMARFQGLHMTQGDGVHFNAKGGTYVGDRVVDALGRAFTTWSEAHPRAGCDGEREREPASSDASAPGDTAR